MSDPQIYRIKHAGQSVDREAAKKENTGERTHLLGVMSTEPQKGIAIPSGTKRSFLIGQIVQPLVFGFRQGHCYISPNHLHEEENCCRYFIG